VRAVLRLDGNIQDLREKTIEERRETETKVKKKTYGE
jgi:hypothetical protein